MTGILFLCVHNAGRSQMAAGFARSFGGVHTQIFSGGSEPRETINPIAVEAMNEVGIDISTFQPQKFTMEMLNAVDVVVTMGCGDACPYIPGKKYIDWPLNDPAGQSIESVRLIRDEILHNVVELLLDYS
ncbi:low molecular weight phosphotyrosine protein phosphatase [Actinomycetes bacterium]|nr:low molecular weight phosphotyrosine protein phosphatase [Actinomycetes bacterium]